VLKRLKEVCAHEQVQHDNRYPFIGIEISGLDALIFTAEGDMRQAINNLQATHTGFRFVDRSNVFKVCDVPNIESLKLIIEHMTKS
jgi:replication factor C subunit 2/4